MKQRLLGGQTGLRVSELALGTGRLGIGENGLPDDDTAARVMAAFAEAGGSFFDTSSAYQLGRSEERLGAFMAEAGRDRFVIASKYGRTALPAPAPAMVGCHRGAMVTEIEGSLRRLRTDRIDLYFPHFDDGLTPMEEIMSGLDALVRTGKILHVGLSNFPAWRSATAAVLAELRGWAPLAVLQLDYSLLNREAEQDQLPFARTRGLGVMAYSPLGGGQLGRRSPKRGDGTGDLLADTLAAIADAQDAAPAGVALAWVRMRGTIPVLGARTLAHLATGLASGVLDLGAGQIEALDQASRVEQGRLAALLAQARQHHGLDSVSDRLREAKAGD